MEAMAEGMDLGQGRAEYRITGSVEAVRDTLRGKPEFEPDDREREPGDPEGTEYCVRLRRGESKKIEERMDPSSSIS